MFDDIDDEELERRAHEEQELSPTGKLVVIGCLTTIILVVIVLSAEALWK
jgi:CHASE3 domain sensor protein